MHINSASGWRKPGIARSRARLLVRTAALMALLTGPAHGADAWEAIGPERIGTRFEEISRGVALQCRDEAARRLCTVSNPSAFAGVPVKRIEAVFEAARLEQVRVILGVEHYPSLLRSLKGRYGSGEDRSFQAIAGMGGEFLAEVFVWRIDAARLVLEQYAGKIDRSVVTYGSARHLEELWRKTHAYPRGARRDL